MGPASGRASRSGWGDPVRSCDSGKANHRLLGSASASKFYADSGATVRSEARIQASTTRHPSLGTPQSDSPPPIVGFSPRISSVTFGRPPRRRIAIASTAGSRHGCPTDGSLGLHDNQTSTPAWNRGAELRPEQPVEGVFNARPPALVRHGNCCRRARTSMAVVASALAEDADHSDMDRMTRGTGSLL